MGFEHVMVIVLTHVGQKLLKMRWMKEQCGSNPTSEGECKVCAVHTSRSNGSARPWLGRVSFFS